MGVKKTGYSDIDQLLLDTHNLLKQGELLKKEINISLKHKPVNPFALRKEKIKRYRKLYSKLNNDES
jgi:hypothetical protein